MLEDFLSYLLLPLSFSPLTFNIETGQCNWKSTSFDKSLNLQLQSL